MAMSYNKLWKLMIDKKMNRTQLRKAAQISSNAMAKLGRDEAVNIAILGKICSVLDCDFGDIVEYIKDGEEHD
ncbi:helix-turn-helix transcriptional regulator [Blautia sp. MSJ-36]|nr:helix-turn-helix transcriptional regulator [Blautia sp. MSJ-36]